MRVISGLVISFVVLVCTFVLFNIPFPVINDNVYLGTAMTVVAYYVLSTLVTTIFGMAAAIVGAVLGAILATIAGTDVDKAMAAGCLAILFVLVFAIGAEIVFLMEVYRFIPFFPVFTFWPAVFVAITTSLFAFISSNRSSED